MVLALDYKTVVFGRFRNARSAVNVILECEAREPHTPVSPHSPSLILHSLQTFRSNQSNSLTVARVRKKYDCFAVYTSLHGSHRKGEKTSALSAGGWLER